MDLQTLIIATGTLRMWKQKPPAVTKAVLENVITSTHVPSDIRRSRIREVINSIVLERFEHPSQLSQFYPAYLYRQIVPLAKIALDYLDGITKKHTPRKVSSPNSIGRSIRFESYSRSLASYKSKGSTETSMGQLV
jgi:hypothetical protein